MKRPLHKINAFWLVLSLALALISAVGASIAQTSGGAVTITTLTWETPTGKTMSALLLKPDAATAKDKRPAIVLAHGWWNNKEMQDSNYVELARRGYVVLSIDMYGHGNSDWLQEGHEAEAATGMYDGVKEIASLPYVDTSKIGISGHSNGARAANWAIPLDDAASTPLISAVYLVDNDPVYADPKTGKYLDYYGSRDVGVQADQYDEFFFRSYNKDGSEATPPRDYITTPNAQSFLHFGADPTDKAKRTSYHAYSQEVDGRKVIREVDNPAQIHPWGPFSSTEVDGLLTFFNRTLGTPNPIAVGSQIWQIKEAFNALGLIAFAMFLVAFSKALLGTRLFAGLRLAEPAALTVRNRLGLGWFWGALAVSAVFSGVSYIWMGQSPWVATFAFTGTPPINPDGAVSFIAIWAALNGVFTLLVMLVSYFAFGRRSGHDLAATGVLPGWRKFWLGILLGLLVVIAAFGIVFVLGYLFQTDFRFWVLAIKPFGADKIYLALLYLPLFLIYYILNSVAVNGFNRFSIRGKEWINTALLALFNALAPIILVIAQYVHFFVTGDLIPGFPGITGIWLYPVIVFLAVAAVVSRKIYRATNNPYIGGFIMASVASLVSVSNTLAYYQ